MSGEYQTYCEGCIVSLTVKHIITECPEYSQQRNAVFQRGEPLMMTQALGDSYQGVDEIFRFLIQCNILHKI